MTAASATQENAISENRTVTAPDISTPEHAPASPELEAADLQTDMENFRLDEAIEGLRTSSMEMKAKTEAEQETRANREAAIWDIAVDVQVVLGTLNLKVADLLAMKPDTSFPLGMASEAPLELVAGGHTIGWCELVAPEGDSGTLSIRITKLSGAGLDPVASVATHAAASVRKAG